MITLNSNYWAVPEPGRKIQEDLGKLNNVNIKNATMMTAMLTYKNHALALAADLIGFKQYNAKYFDYCGDIAKALAAYNGALIAFYKQSQ